jgi:hypothetical protein
VNVPDGALEDDCALMGFTVDKPNATRLMPINAAKNLRGLLKVFIFAIFQRTC